MAKAQAILDDFGASLPKFVKVMPTDYKAVLLANEAEASALGCTLSAEPLVWGSRHGPLPPACADEPERPWDLVVAANVRLVLRRA